MKDKANDHWKEGWLKLENEGNPGIERVINPYLYREMASCLENHTNATVVDFGAGTNSLAIQFMHGDPESVFGLRDISNISDVRQSVRAFIGLEEDETLVKKGQEVLTMTEDSGRISIRQFHVKSDNDLVFDDEGVSLAVSRNFVMHLHTNDLLHHMSEVSRILQHNGEYILAFLNPEYEQKKFLDSSPHKTPLKVNDEYLFPHGANGELGHFQQYWKGIATYERCFSEYFDVSKKITCKPFTDELRERYPRYYDEQRPAAFVYVLRKKKI